MLEETTAGMWMLYVIIVCMWYYTIQRARQDACNQCKYCYKIRQERMHHKTDQPNIIKDDSKMDDPSYWESTLSGKGKIVKRLYYFNDDFRDKIDKHILNCQECASLKPFAIHCIKIRKEKMNNIREKEARENLVKACKKQD